MNPIAGASVSSLPATRLVSLDALRGFDMCCILGLTALLDSLLKRFLPGSDFTAIVTKQFTHVPWEGLHFEDVIFPLFLFISGVSMTLALPKRIASHGKAGALKHLLVRAVIIFVLGVFASGGLSQGLEKVRWLGVLQRIAIATAAAGMLSLFLGRRGVICATVTLLGGYYLMLEFIPVPGVGAGNFTEGHNLTNYLDSIWLPGRKYDGNHDPEGILSTLPAIASALLGILAGQWLQGTASPKRKVLGFFVSGAILVALGWAWHPAFPVVKKLWSSSFVLVAGGWSAILLGVFYWIVEVRGWNRWCKPFVWVGANPITLYLVAGLGVFRTMAERLVGHPGVDEKWLTALIAFSLMLLFARWLFRRGILIRV